MSAIQKTRKIFEESNVGFNSQTLVESSNENKICQKVEILMGGTPDPQNTGAYKSTVVSFNKTFKTVTLSSTTEAAKFVAGDNVVLYSSTQNNKISKIKNCVKSVFGDTLLLYSPLTDIPGNIIIEKNLIFRVSNVSTYRVDEYGIGRAYDAIAGLSEVEASMGEMLEGKWNRSDYSFTIDNYDKKFNAYMPGGELYSTFALREVNVFVGFGEEFEKNKLIFTGYTNLNNGVSEDNEKLKFTAYDVSYIYNIPVQLNKFSNSIVDPEYRGKPIPVLFGDYTSYGQYVGGIQRPIIPTVLIGFSNSSTTAKLILNASPLGIYKSFQLIANTTGTTYNSWQIELKYSNEEKASSFTPTGVETSLGGGKYKAEITLYRGKRTDGTLFSSTKWIKQCLQTLSNFNTNFTFLYDSNEALLYYKNLVLPNREDNYVGDIAKTELFYTNGGSTSVTAIYKICSNGIDPDNVANYKVWYNYGNYDTVADWEPNANYHGGGGPVPLQWDFINGEVAVTLTGSHTLDIMLKAKMYVFVSGQKLGTNLKTDSDLALNFSNFIHSTISINELNFSNEDYSGNGADLQFLGLPQAKEGENFPLGGCIQVSPFMERKAKKVVNGVETNVDILVNEFSTLKYNFRRQTAIESKNFIFEMQFNDETGSLFMIDYLFRQRNTSTKYLAVLGENETNKIYVYMDSNRYINVLYNGQLTTCSTTQIPTTGTKIYGLKVVKDTNKIRVYLKNITDGGTYAEESYTVQPTLTGTLGALNYCLVGNSSTTPSYSTGGFYGKIGMIRFRTNQTTFQHESFTKYNVVENNDDIVSIAKKLLQFGGVTSDLFDSTWDNFYNSKINQDHNVRCYINDVDIKTIDYVVELLVQIGIILTMKESKGKMKFSLIWDNLEFYKLSTYRITSYDIELDSVSIDRELNQYFNTANAKFNYNPATDDLAYATVDLYEPNAIIRDANLNVWFKREDKGEGNFEFPNLYIESEVQQVLKYRIANATPNSEMITMKLSWRHLGLQIGDFVILNHNRYVNVPCQVRSIKLDANGSSIEVKLRSLENINFLDKNRNETYTPLNFDNIGGIQAITNILTQSDGGDV